MQHGEIVSVVVGTALMFTLWAVMVAVLMLPLTSAAGWWLGADVPLLAACQVAEPQARLERRAEALIPDMPPRPVAKFLMIRAHSPGTRATTA